MPDTIHLGLWRVRWPDGRLSDATNIARAKDAIACFMETESRRQRGGRALQKPAYAPKLKPKGKESPPALPPWDELSASETPLNRNFGSGKALEPATVRGDETNT